MQHCHSLTLVRAQPEATATPEESTAISATHLSITPAAQSSTHRPLGQPISTAIASPGSAPSQKPRPRQRTESPSRQLCHDLGHHTGRTPKAPPWPACAPLLHPGASAGRAAANIPEPAKQARTSARGPAREDRRAPERLNYLCAKGRAREVEGLSVHHPQAEAMVKHRQLVECRWWCGVGGRSDQVHNTPASRGCSQRDPLP